MIWDMFLAHGLCCIAMRRHSRIGSAGFDSRSSQLLRCRRVNSTTGFALASPFGNIFTTFEKAVKAASLNMQRLTSHQHTSSVLQGLTDCNLHSGGTMWRFCRIAPTPSRCNCIVTSSMLAKLTPRGPSKRMIPTYLSQLTIDAPSSPMSPQRKTNGCWLSHGR